MVTQMNTNRILIFLAIAFGIPWAVAPATVIRPGLALVLNLIFITAPALANVATRLVTREGWGHLWLRPNVRRGWRFYLAAWFLPVLAMLAGALVYFLLFPRSFDSELTGMRTMYEKTSITGAVIGLVPANSWTLVLAVMLEAMLIGLIVNGVLAIGEEFGWRAYLLHKLMDRLHSARKAALLVGVIHGVWHWPSILVVFGNDPTFSGQLALFLPVYLVSTISMGILLAWVTLRSGSVWPASVGHGLVVTSMGLAASVLKGSPILPLGPGMNGLIGGLGFLALALVLYFYRGAFAEEKEAVTERAPAVTGRISA